MSAFPWTTGTFQGAGLESEGVRKLAFSNFSHGPSLWSALDYQQESRKKGISLAVAMLRGEHTETEIS